MNDKQQPPRRNQQNAPQHQRNPQDRRPVENKPAQARYREELDRVAKDVESMLPELASLLMATTDPGRVGQFVNEIQIAITKAFKKDGSNPLLDADPASFRSAVREAAGFGYSLNPRLGECYLIPRKGVVELQSGYKGLNKLAYRSGIISSLHADCVYKGESYKRIGGTDRPRIEHSPDDTGILRTNKWPDILCAYALAFIGDSTHPIFQVAPRWRLTIARGEGTTDAWKGHPDAMCRKTALIMLASELPRHDKLREFHLAVERELENERADPELFVSMDVPESAGREWLEAVEAYASIGVSEQNLLDYLAIETSAALNNEHLTTLEDLFGRGRKGDKGAATEFEKMRAGPQPAVAATTEPDVGQQDAEPAPLA
jgi:phage RecT family recombinase